MKEKKFEKRDEANRLWDFIYAYHSQFFKCNHECVLCHGKDLRCKVTETGAGLVREEYKYNHALRIYTANLALAQQILDETDFEMK